jgi:hypothetical protein
MRIPVADSWVREAPFATDDVFLAGLTRKHRYHQRTRVLAREPEFDVEVLAGGSATATALPAVHRDVLYDRYRAVHARAFDLNVFPLPRRLIDAVLGSPAFEIVVLRLAGRPRAPGGEDVVAFAVQHVTDEHVVPLFVGLDYGYVATHSSYQVLLLQALRSAQRRGSREVRFGMGADLQKARFGARREKRWAYVAAGETYNADVLAHLAETVPAR